MRESQETVSRQSNRAIIPPMPLPATPVNAVAANIPVVENSVFLGSGSLGVVDLGGGRIKRICTNFDYIGSFVCSLIKKIPKILNKNPK